MFQLVGFILWPTVTVQHGPLGKGMCRCASDC